MNQQGATRAGIVSGLCTGRTENETMRKQEEPHRGVGEGDLASQLH